MPLCSSGRRDFGGNVSVTEVAIIIVVETIAVISLSMTNVPDNTHVQE